jgi:cell wall-associated NlpC family hydrolase
MQNPASQRAAVVAEARSWLRTPYHHEGDLKRVGVDCGMLVVRCFVDTGIVAPFDPRPYSRQWMLHRDEEVYLGFVFDRSKAVASPQPGDVAVYKFGRCYSHGGIITGSDPLTIIHAFSRAGMVIEEPIAQNAELMKRKRVPQYFSVWRR